MWDLWVAAIITTAEYLYWLGSNSSDVECSHDADSYGCSGHWY